MNNTISTNEGSLFYDKSRNKWRIQFKYESPSGIIKRKSFSGSTKSEVKNKKKFFERQLALNRITETSYCTAVDLLKENAEYDYRIGDIQEAGYSRRVFTISIIEKSIIGDIPIVKLNEPIINEFLFNIKNGYSNSVIGKVYSALNKAFKIAINKRVMTYNPMDSPFIKKPKSARKDVKVYAFTLEEQQIFLEALKVKRFQSNNIDYNSMFMIELYSGLRMGEICALTEENIDLIHKMIYVRNTITRDLNYTAKVGDSTKTPRGVRDVPMHPRLVEVFNKVIDNYIDNEDNLLFYNHKQQRPVSTCQVNNYFHRLCKKANLKTSGGQHLLRHTYATRCIEADVPPEVLKNWLGHKDISTTLNTYCDVFAKRHDKAMELFTKYTELSAC